MLLLCGIPILALLNLDAVSGRTHSLQPHIHLVPLTRIYPKKSQLRNPRKLQDIIALESHADQPSLLETFNTLVSQSAFSSLSTHHSRAKRGHAYDIEPHGTIPLTNLRDSQYVGPVGVGTNLTRSPQAYVNVVFDTGSTNLWVSSSKCHDYVCRDRHKYDNSESITFTEPPPDALPLDITFGTGELSGPQAVDSLSVGPYVVHNQTFAMIEHEIGSIFSQIPFEGILGLAFPSMAADNHTPFFDNVMQQNVLSGRNEFSFFFTKLPDQASAIFFGGVDQRFFDGKIRMFPVVQPHYWAIELVDFLIGNKSYAIDETPKYFDFSSYSPQNNKDNNKQRITKLIIDTGTTYFTAPTGLTSQILQLVPGTRCADTSKYPDITYKLVDEDGLPFDLVVPPSVYMVTDDGEWCEPAFMAIDVPSEYGPALLLGEVFMRHWHTTFDRGDGSEGSAFVGFALAKHDPEAMKELEITRMNYYI
jgi:pepsin A